MAEQTTQLTVDALVLDDHGDAKLSLAVIADRQCSPPHGDEDDDDDGTRCR